MKVGQTNKQQFWFVAKRGIAIWALFLEKLQTPFCSCWQWSQENSQSFKYTSCVFMLSSHTLSVSCACSGFSQHVLNYDGKYSISCRLCSLLKQLLISLFLKKMKYVVEERPFLENIRVQICNTGRSTGWSLPLRFSLLILYSCNLYVEGSSGSVWFGSPGFFCYIDL